MGNYIKDKKNKELILILLLTVITGYFGATGFPVLLLIYPAFSITVGVKYENKYGLGIVLASAILLSVFLGVLYAPLYLSYLGITYIMSKGIRSRIKISEILLRSSSYIFILVTIAMVFLRLVFDIDIIDNIVRNLESDLNTNLEIIQSMDYEYDIESLRESFELFIDYISAVFPAVILMFSLSVSAFTYGIASYIIRKNSIKDIPAFRLQDFRLSYRFSLTAIIAFVTSLVMNVLNIGNYDLLVSNLTLIIFLLLFLQGLGVISYYLYRTKIGRFLRVAILVFLIMSSYLATFISIFGAIDVVFNFRKIKED